MKTSPLFIYKFLFITLFCFYLTSCSKDNTTNEENSTEQLLIENSPWTFENYKLIEIKNGENNDITYLENEVNVSFEDYELIFYKESIGSSENKSGNLSSFIWRVSDNTIIITTSSTNSNDIEYLKNITVKQSEFTFEGDFGSYDDSTGNITLHSGTYFFN